MMRYRVAVLALVLVCAACTTHIQSNPPRTATEQMLISTAAERAADKLAVTMPPNTKVFVDGSNFEGTDSKYALGAIRTALLKKGAALVDDKKNADLVVEARAGALSTDQNSTIIGIPSFNVPIPLASGPLTFPEIAFYKNAEQQGVAKFAVTGYRRADGTLVTAQDPQYGFSYRDEKTVMIFFTWTESDATPTEDQEAAERDVRKVSDTLAPPPSTTATASVTAPPPATQPQQVLVGIPLSGPPLPVGR